MPIVGFVTEMNGTPLTATAKLTDPPPVRFGLSISAPMLPRLSINWVSQMRLAVNASVGFGFLNPSLSSAVKFSWLELRRF